MGVTPLVFKHLLIWFLVQFSVAGRAQLSQAILRIFTSYRRAQLSNLMGDLEAVGQLLPSVSREFIGVSDCVAICPKDQTGN